VCMLRCGPGRGAPAVASVAGNPSNAAATKKFAADGSSSASRIHAPDARGRRLAASQLAIPGDSFGRSLPRRPPSTLRAKHLHRSAARLPPMSPLSPLSPPRRLHRSPINFNLVRPDLQPDEIGPQFPPGPAQPSQAQSSPAKSGSGSGRAVETAPKMGRSGLPQKDWSGALQLAAELGQTVVIESHMWLMFASVASGQTTHRLR
jgi:hypothetical protein